MYIGLLKAGTRVFAGLSDYGAVQLYIEMMSNASISAELEFLIFSDTTQAEIKAQIVGILAAVISVPI